MKKTKRACDVFAEICIRVLATSPKEAAELFEKGLDKAFPKYNINDRIRVIDVKTDNEQWEGSEEFELEAYEELLTLAQLAKLPSDHPALDKLYKAYKGA